MKAVILENVNQSVELKEVEIPTIGSEEVLVKINAAALNHRDVWIQKGMYPGIKLPAILGSDGAGVVVEAGESVDKNWAGKSVIINPSHNWGNNDRFYSKDFKILGMPDNGTFAQYAKVEAKYIYGLPTHLSFIEAAALPLAGLTAWRALITRAQARSNSRVLITGIGGGVALFAFQFALALGAEVWVTSGSDQKIERAIQLGAKGGVNYKSPDWAKELIAATGGNKAGYFDAIVDSAGGTGFAKLIDVATAGARICFYGGTTGNITDIVPGKVFFKQLDIMGSTMGTDAEFKAMTEFVQQHKIVPIIDKIFAFDDAEQALRYMDIGTQFGKIVLEIND